MANEVMDSKDLAFELGYLARDLKCKDVRVVDLRGKSPATEFFVIATSTSSRQSKTVADEIEQHAKDAGHRRFGRAGYELGRWILIDFVTVVVHVFDEEYRDYYELESLWGDAEEVLIK